MSWAARRRFIILFIIGAALAAFVAVVAIATFYKAPTCTDRVQNQDEAGVDCGGGCAYLCTAEQQPPTVLFTKALDNGAGRTDVIALVENKNVAAAARAVPYSIALFDDRQTLIREMEGTLDLPPGATVPVYVPGAASGSQAALRAFLSIEASAPKWYALPASARSLPIVSSTKQSGTVAAPRVEAVIENLTTAPLRDVRAVVLVRDASGSVIAASETLLPVIGAQGQATALFTWSGAFGGIPAALEVLPILPLR